MPRDTAGERVIPDLLLLLLLPMFSNPSVLRTPPLYFAVQNTEEEGILDSVAASAPILYVTPRNATGHGRGGV